MQHCAAQNGDFIRVQKIETGPCSFIDHIRIKALRTQQGDPLFQLHPPGNEIVKNNLKVSRLPFIALPADQTILTVESMKAEISQNAECSGRQNQTPENRLFTMAGGN